MRRFFGAMGPASRVLLVLTAVVSVAFSLKILRQSGLPANAVAAAIGLGMSAALWVVAAVFVWAGGRALSRSWTFAGALQSPLAILVPFLVMGVSFAGALGPPADRDMPRVVTEHMELHTGCLWQGREKNQQHWPQFVAALQRADWASAADVARRQEAGVGAVHDCLDRLPSTRRPELDEAADRVATAMGEMVAVWSVYRRAAERQDVDGLSEGDRRSKRAELGWIDAHNALGKVVDRWAPGKRFRPAALR